MYFSSELSGLCFQFITLQASPVKSMISLSCSWKISQVRRCTVSLLTLNQTNLRERGRLMRTTYFSVRGIYCMWKGVSAGPRKWLLSWQHWEAQGLKRSSSAHYSDSVPKEPHCLSAMLTTEPGECLLVKYPSFDFANFPTLAFWSWKILAIY